MAAPTPKTRGLERRQLILDTALRMIATGGVDSITHRRVADAAGVPLGSTTYYFESREHLLREAFDHYLTFARALQKKVAEEKAAKEKAAKGATAEERAAYKAQKQAEKEQMAAEQRARKEFRLDRLFLVAAPKNAVFFF